MDVMMHITIYIYYIYVYALQDTISTPVQLSAHPACHTLHHIHRMLVENFMRLTIPIIAVALIVLVRHKIFGSQGSSKNQVAFKSTGPC